MNMSGPYVLSPCFAFVFIAIFYHGNSHDSFLDRMPVRAMKSRVLTWLVPVSAASAAGMGIALVREADAWTYGVLLGLSGLTTLALLIRLYRLMPRLDGVAAEPDPKIYRLHTLLHAVLFGLLASRRLTPDVYRSVLPWLAPMLLFFYTGRRTWIGLHKLFRSKMYYAFIRGNTGLFVASLIMAAAAAVSGGEQTAEWLRRLERLWQMYAVIHFALTGPAIGKIEKDVLKGT